jgi:hypothetical protein
MKILTILSLLIPLNILFSQTEQISPVRNYLIQSEKLISEKSPKITVKPYTKKKFKAIFIKYKIDSLFYYDLDTKTESKIALLEIERIGCPDMSSAFGEISVFIGRDYKYRLQMSPEGINQILNKQTEITQTQEESVKINNILKPSLMERSTIALERIALVETYFMVYSIVATVLSILIVLQL